MSCSAPSTQTSIPAQQCPGCGGFVPLTNLEDRVSRGRRVLRQSCDGCGHTYVARFRQDGGRWALIGKVKKTRMGALSGA